MGGWRPTRAGPRRDLVIIDRWEQHLNLHPELGNSLYDLHSDGSGICYSSRLRPVLNMRPMAMNCTAGLGSMLWGYNADTHLTDWLEAKEEGHSAESRHAGATAGPGLARTRGRQPKPPRHPHHSQRQRPGVAQRMADLGRASPSP